MSPKCAFSSRSAGRAPPGLEHSQAEAQNSAGAKAARARQHAKALRRPRARARRAPPRLSGSKRARPSRLRRPHAKSPQSVQSARKRDPSLFFRPCRCSTRPMPASRAGHFLEYRGLQLCFPGHGSRRAHPCSGNNSAKNAGCYRRQLVWVGVAV